MSIECTIHGTCRGFAIENGLTQFILDNANDVKVYANGTARVWRKGIDQYRIYLHAFKKI